MLNLRVVVTLVAVFMLMGCGDSTANNISLDRATQQVVDDLLLESGPTRALCSGPAAKWRGCAIFARPGAE